MLGDVKSDTFWLGFAKQKIILFWSKIATDYGYFWSLRAYRKNIPIDSWEKGQIQIIMWLISTGGHKLRLKWLIDIWLLANNSGPPQTLVWSVSHYQAAAAAGPLRLSSQLVRNWLPVSSHDEWIRFTSIWCWAAIIGLFTQHRGTWDLTMLTPGGLWTSVLRSWTLTHGQHLSAVLVIPSKPFNTAEVLQWSDAFIWGQRYRAFLSQCFLLEGKHINILDKIQCLWLDIIDRFFADEWLFFCFCI